MKPFLWGNLLLLSVFLTNKGSWLVRREPDANQSILFYDGDCGLCSRIVQFFIARDPRGLFRFAPLKGSTAAKLLPPALRRPGDPYETVVLLDQAGVHSHSTAVIRALSHLGGGWTVVKLLLSIPRPFRDAAYGFIARRRYDWFGDSSSCPLNTGAHGGRFLP